MAKHTHSSLNVSIKMCYLHLSITNRGDAATYKSTSLNIWQLDVFMRKSSTIGIGISHKHLHEKKKHIHMFNYEISSRL